jgi:hypothetical protein
MRHLVSYLLFVGIPLAGLLGVLRLGQGLEAPRAVHGAWAVQPMASPGRACHRHLLAGGDSTLTISQSGRQLSAKLGPGDAATLRGRLIGAELVLEGAIQPGSALRHAGCAAGDSVRVAARLVGGGPVERLDARLWTSACPECGAVEFTAVQPRGHRGRRP